MKFLILSRNKFSYSNKRLHEEAKRLDIKLQICDPADFDMVLGKQSPSIVRLGKVFPKVDCVIPRLGASITNYGLSVVSQFEMMQVPVLNTYSSIATTKNKLSCIQRLSQKDIDIPKTVIIRKPSELSAAVKTVGGFPVILKLLSGTQGIGVMLVENITTMEATLDTLWSLGQDILIQECIKESLGKDLRVVVVGGKVVGSMRRQARIGDFRSNFHRGGLTTKIDISDSIEKIAIEASETVGLQVAGVDILESDQGPRVIEVNSSPGLEGIEGCTGINIAKAILEHAREYCRKK
ncbi:MAG TPA: RimK family alpha-L-glutamate ligase [Oligoflexia bacterium]|nr:RimK family alpha-L-glutamate ligase [Oligoflexia bacterium]HMR24978.1 RimK family alpha-L-glutamate ligase [Oligoflexia bacterium]